MHARVDTRVGDQRRNDAQRDAACGHAALTPLAKAKADAEWPEGQDVERGIATWRVTGTSCICLSGRRRLPSGFSTRFTTADVRAMEARPFSGRAALAAACGEQGGAAEPEPRPVRGSESRRSATSMAGVGVAAIAA